MMETDGISGVRDQAGPDVCGVAWWSVRMHERSSVAEFTALGTFNSVCC